MGGRYWVWLAARLVIAVAIVGWAFSYLSPNGSGEKEFQKALDAMKQVRSVRLERVAEPLGTKQHSEFSSELVCSQNTFHNRIHMVDNASDPPVDFTSDALDLGSASYELQRDGTWKKGYGSGTSKLMCSRLSQGENSNLLPDIATMIKRGIIEKSDKKTVHGVRCREWKVTLKGGYSGLEHDTICLGLDDHLPYEMTVDWEHSRTVFSDYNLPFQIDVPTELQPVSDSTATN